MSLKQEPKLNEFWNFGYMLTERLFQFLLVLCEGDEENAYLQYLHLPEFKHDDKATKETNEE